MATLLIVAPVFALIAAGYAAVLFRFVSEGAHKGISEFAFSIAIPALLFRTIVVSEFPDVSPRRMWGAYYGALALTGLRRSRSPRCCAHGAKTARTASCSRSARSTATS